MVDLVKVLVLMWLFSVNNPGMGFMTDIKRPSHFVDVVISFDTQFTVVLDFLLSTFVFLVKMTY